MIGLVLLACHMVGDYDLQTRWQASRKILERSYRLRHVAAYTVPFTPVAILYARSNHLPWWHWAGFLAGLAVLHYATDSYRCMSTLGDWLAYTGYWYLHWRTVITQSPNFTTEQRLSGKRPPRPVVGPNPWEPIPIMIDQSLHLAQIAALGFLLTR